MSRTLRAERDDGPSSAPEETPLPHLGPVPVTVYAAMFGGTIIGQLFGMSVDALVIGRRVVWVPLACSVLLEALAAVRFGAGRVAHRLRWGEWGQVSAYYSGCLVALSLPLAGWTVAYNRRLATAGTSREVASALGVVITGVVVATVLRSALMALVASRRES